MLDATAITNKSFTRSQFNRTGTRFKRHSTPDPQMIKLRTLNKHIQTHNVSQILGDNQIVMDSRKAADFDVTVDERKEISANLTGLKKKFDETRDTCNKKEKEINWMRTEIDKLRATDQFFKDDSIRNQTKCEQLKFSIDAQKLKLEEVLYSRSSYLHMLDRMKKDKIADQIKVKVLESQLNREVYDLSMEEIQARKARQFHVQTRIVFDDIIKQVEQEEKKRVQSLYAFEQNLNTKEEVERKREERIKRTQDIAENAAAEIRDSNEKKWRELLMVHRFLASFLKKKMDREMKTYESVERAFQKIKASTGLADAREIVSKFVRREDTYSELLISIASYEKKIEELRKTNDILKSKVHILKEKNVPIEKTRNDHDENLLIEVFKELHAKTETYKVAKLKIEKVRDWSIKTLLRIDKSQNIMKNDYYALYPKDKVVESFLNVISTVERIVDSVNEENVNNILAEIDGVRMEDIENKDYVAKNVRVKSSVGRVERMRSDSQSNSRANISRDASEAADESGKEEDSTDEDELFNKHLQAQRMEIKLRTQEEMLKKKKQKEKEEELARMNNYQK